MRLLRLIRILWIALRFGLDEFVLGHERFRAIRPLVGVLLSWRKLEGSRSVRLRLALEELGPIFVKFGQMLSTRRDLLPPDLADELAKLQDQVPAFAASKVRETLERTYQQRVEDVFRQFDFTPVASASVAQVHLALLPDGREVAVKILRPRIRAIIAHDIALLDAGAALMRLLWREGRRLRPHEVVAEFAKHLEDELDLMREASSASQLRRNFEDSPLLLVPEIHWDFCSEEVMVMERMHGTPVSHVGALRAQGIDIPRLARAGVEIFFTQVFRDGFFHADMHPGNIFVDREGRYIALDFGIMGTLSDTDRHYLAQNFLAFFHRDYRRVAEAHIESGWAPKATRVDEFEAAIRAVCEPVFDRPLKEISLGKLLMRLFQTSRRFNIEVQPQLVLLQKTLLNIEGLGRDLDPDLDLWVSAQPYLERWMSEQIGWRGLVRRVKQEAPNWGVWLPQMPRLVHRALAETPQETVASSLARLAREQRRHTWLLVVLAILMGSVLTLLLQNAR
jgi:ubiquinone biosynthesis protein